MHLNELTVGFNHVLRILNDSSKWIKGASSKNAAGIWVHPDHPSAVCWCLAGACATIEDTVVRNKVIALLRDNLPPGFNELADWNDHYDTSYQDVIDFVTKVRNS